MQTPEGEIAEDDRGRVLIRGKKSRKMKRGTAAESSWLCPLQIIKVSLVCLGLGLGQDVLQVKNRDQYAGHRTRPGESSGERGRECVHSVYRRNPHFLRLTTTLMTLFPHTQFISVLTASHAGYFHFSPLERLRRRRATEDTHTLTPTSSCWQQC